MVYPCTQSLSPAGLLINGVEIGPDCIFIAARCRAAVGRCVRAPIGDAHPSGVHSRYGASAWTCLRAVTLFGCGSRFADFAALSPVAGDAFSPSDSTRRWPAGQRGALSGSKRSSTISALPWVVAPPRRWRGG